MNNDFISISDDGRALIHGKPIDEFLSNENKPQFIISLDKIIQNYRMLKNEIDREFKESDYRFKVFYSLKTNADPAILRALAAEGCGVQVVSEYELDLALKTGFKSENINAGGVAKSDRYVSQCMQVKPYMVYVDSEEEFNYLIEKSNDSPTHISIGLSIQDKQGSKIGISKEKIPCILASKGKYIQSLHYHAGTQQTTVNQMTNTLNTILGLLKKQDKENDLHSINIGGGFPSFAHMPDGYLRKLFPAIRNFLNQSHNALGKITDLCIEPGRLLVADAGILLTRVKAIKRDYPDSWIFLDAGMNAINKQFSKARVRFLIANRMQDSYNHPFNIAGPLPSRVDTFTKHYPLPKKTKVGDPVIITNAGAYTLPFLMNFCFPRPSITIIDS